MEGVYAINRIGLMEQNNGSPNTIQQPKTQKFLIQMLIHGLRDNKKLGFGLSFLPRDAILISVHPFHKLNPSKLPHYPVPDLPRKRIALYSNNLRLFVSQRLTSFETLFLNSDLDQRDPKLSHP